MHHGFPLFLITAWFDGLLAVVNAVNTCGVA